jgi:hypothetical protein
MNPEITLPSTTQPSSTRHFLVYSLCFLAFILLIGGGYYFVSKKENISPVQQSNQTQNNADKYLVVSTTTPFGVKMDLFCSLFNGISLNASGTLSETASKGQSPCIISRNNIYLANLSAVSKTPIEGLKVYYDDGNRVLFETDSIADEYNSDIERVFYESNTSLTKAGSIMSTFHSLFECDGTCSELSPNLFVKVLYDYEIDIVKITDDGKMLFGKLYDKSSLVPQDYNLTIQLEGAPCSSCGRLDIVSLGNDKYKIGLYKDFKRAKEVIVEFKDWKTREEMITRFKPQQ